MKRAILFSKAGSGSIIGRVTIPKEILETLKISRGDEVDITLEGDKIIMKKVEKNMNKLLKNDFDYCNKVLEEYHISYELKKECLNILALEREFNLDEIKKKNEKEKSSYVNGFYEGSIIFINRLLDKKLKDTVDEGYSMQIVEEALNKLYKLQVINEEVFADEYDIEIVKTYEAPCSAEDVEEIAVIARKDEKDKNFEYVRINLDTLEYELNYEPIDKELELFK